ncbi:STAS domain-containing protein [Actinoplanes couchii]|uniref:Anti-sigma factor antagonist n=1 Tax=Actinoplanes couchii TaxID=403638 RepID=A0ABQ3XNU1_9ACTN|nr:STAS domain-containing protein [Actinoplanes couchii]MDR6319624.1 anti-anti-sigma factor [Actinoplanes couchii]GID60153.1 hypothetical protein Aco03nite_085570 [Actinoplanes couchii]
MTATPAWSADDVSHGTTCTVLLHGELDLAAADELRRLLDDHLDTAGTTTVIADLSQVSFLDSGALGALVAVRNHAEDIGRHFALQSPTATVRRVLDTGGVYDLMVTPNE